MVFKKIYFVHKRFFIVSFIILKNRITESPVKANLAFENTEPFIFLLPLGYSLFILRDPGADNDGERKLKRSRGKSEDVTYVAEQFYRARVGRTRARREETRHARFLPHARACAPLYFCQTFSRISVASNVIQVPENTLRSL